MNSQGDQLDASNTEDIANFRRKMDSLKPMERRTAQAFLDCGIHHQFRWPLENESKEDAVSRKSINEHH